MKISFLVLSFNVIDGLAENGFHIFDVTASKDTSIESIIHAIGFYLIVQD